VTEAAFSLISSKSLAIPLEIPCKTRQSSRKRDGPHGSKPRKTAISETDEREKAGSLGGKTANFSIIQPESRATLD
jgi:hypothetical protein